MTVGCDACRDFFPRFRSIDVDQCTVVLDAKGEEHKEEHMSDLRPLERFAVINGIRQWLRNWRGSNSSLFECCREDEVARVARDLAMSTSEFRRVADHGPGAADLLVRRMVVLNLDRNEVAATAPSALQDLQRLCTMCESHGRCARDLAREPAEGAWEDYCPNAAMLKVLDAAHSLGGEIDGTIVEGMRPAAEKKARIHRR